MAPETDTPSAATYADWVVEYCAKEIGAPIDPMSLEKHLYYAQAFSGLAEQDLIAFIDAKMKASIPAASTSHVDMIGSAG